MSQTMKDTLMTELSPAVERPHCKVTVVGAGQVGMATAFSLMTQGEASEICLVDVNADKLQGEMMDLQHGQAFLRKIVIKASTDYAASADSKVCIVTSGARPSEGESRLNLVQRNVEIYKGIIPKLVQYSPETILLIVSDPVDILTYLAYRLSGLPCHRVIGSGTMLDSSRFRFLMSQKLDVSPGCIHGHIIGEHGDSSVPVWSAVNIGGVRLRDLNSNIGTEADPEKWEEVHKDVVNSAYEIIKLKGYTSWAISLMVSTLVNAIIKNQHVVYPLSCMVKGYHGIEDEVFLSLPCVIGEKGITNVIQQNLTEEEKQQLQKSASTLASVIQGINY